MTETATHSTRFGGFFLAGQALLLLATTRLTIRCSPNA
jgi:hypothetical protein